METGTWNSKSIQAFWEKNEAPFSGDTNATEIIRLTRRHIKGKVLDVGAGSGSLIGLIPGAIGIDVAPRGPRVLKASIEDLPFPNSSFDTVFATDILEHLPREALSSGIREILRVLRYEGKMILTVPRLEDMRLSQVTCPSCQAVFHRWGHVNRFDRSRVMAMLSDFCELDIREIPLGMMAANRVIHYSWRALVRFGVVQASDFLVVATR